MIARRRWTPAKGLLAGLALAALALGSPAHILLALAEIGPLLLLAPVVMLAIPRYLRSGKLMTVGLAIMALVSMAIPVVITFTERDRDITRLMSTALNIWAALGLPYAWLALRRGRQLTRLAIGVCWAVVIFGGLALFPAQLAAGLQPQASYFIEEPDVWMSSRYWNRLKPDAWMLHTAYPYRPSAPTP